MTRDKNTLEMNLLQKQILNALTDQSVEVRETRKDISRIMIDVGVIQEHLKTLNGKVIENQRRINEQSCDIKNNTISLTKITAFGSMGGFLAGIIFQILFRIIFKGG